MKSKIISLAILTFFITQVGCKFDNYDPPAALLTGKIIYNGNPVGVRSGATQLELWQYGYKLRVKIPVNIAQDGSYTATLFNGNYKLVRLAGAPWANQTDSIDVKVSGNTTADVPVTPFYIITGETFTYNKTDNSINSSCLLTKVGTAAITSLTLYISRTDIVDANNNTGSTTLAAAALTDLTTAKTAKVVVTADPLNRSYVYVRLGVLSAGSTERLYTAVQKISLQ
jgi:Protein of unknown function (DUF3823) N-terminal domain/Domain of unknown function (DUF3823_C)